MATMCNKFIIAILLFFSVASFAQDSTHYQTRHFITLQTGYARHFVKDDIISPLVYSGPSIPVSITYQAHAKKYLHTVTLYFGYLKLTSAISIHTPAEAFYSKNYNAIVAYACNKKMYSNKPLGIHIFAGLHVKGMLNLRDHYYSSYTHYNTGELIASLGASLGIIKKFKKSKNDFISFTCTTSLLGYDALNYLYNANVAKELKTDSGQNTTHTLLKTNSIVSLNKYIEFQPELLYAKFITNSLGFSCRYSFQYYHEQKFRNLFSVESVNYQCTVGVILKL